MSRRANVEDRFALQMLGADLVRDHDRPSSNPSGACRHGLGSDSLSGWLAPPASPSVVRTRPACRRWSARSLRTGRFATARGGVPTSVCSGVAWVSSRFWSQEGGDRPESAASDVVECLFRTSRNSVPSITSADKSVWGSADHGCHGYSSSRTSVPWALSSFVVQWQRPHSAIGNKAPIELIDRSAADGPR
jgi:hypothetical protein